MESNIKNYEEQVLELGNGKMLEPGCYNENMKKLCNVEDIKGSGIKNPGRMICSAFVNHLLKSKFLPLFQQ